MDGRDYFLPKRFLFTLSKDIRGSLDKSLISGDSQEEIWKKYFLKKKTAAKPDQLGRNSSGGEVFEIEYCNNCYVDNILSPTYLRTILDLFFDKNNRNVFYYRIYNQFLISYISKTRNNFIGPATVGFTQLFRIVMSCDSLGFRRLWSWNAVLLSQVEACSESCNKSCIFGALTSI